MIYKVLQGIMIPFIGTTIGSACVLFMKKELNTEEDWEGWQRLRLWKFNTD